MRRLRADSGFTLIESLVAMVLMGVLLAAMTRILVGTSQFGDQTQQAAVHQTEARATLDRMVGEIRQATEGDGSPPFQSIGATQLTFDSPDRGTPFHLRRISYRVANGSLDEATASSTTTTGPPWTFPAQGPWIGQIAGVVNTTVFTYQDDSGATTTDPAAVRSVTITLTVRNGRQSATYQASATVRQSG